MSRRNVFAITLMVIMLVMPVAGCWFTSDALPLKGPVVLQLSDDAVVRDGAAQLARYVDNARILYVPSLFYLERIVNKVVGQVFYVGHGSPEGLTVAAGLVSWMHIQNLVARAPVREHYFAACFSHLPNKLEGKVVMGFDGVVDVDVATNLVAAVAYGIHGQTDKWPELARDFVTNRGMEKLLNPERPLIQITWVIYSGTTPYGVTNPLAMQITITEGEVQQYGTWSMLASAVCAAIGGPWGYVLGFYAAGLAWSLMSMWAFSVQGTTPNAYIRWWIPWDPLNVYLLAQQFGWYFATYNHWWRCFLTWGMIII